MVLALLKCKLREIWRHSIEAGSLLSTRLKWCTFQLCKVQLPTRKLLLWQVYTVRMKAILFYSTNMMWCFIYHIKVVPAANFPRLCPASSKSCTLPCYKVTAAVMTSPLHSTLTSTRKPMYCWWAGCQDSSSPQGITRATGDTQILHRKFSLYTPLLEPAHCPTYMEWQKLGGQLKHWERNRGFTSNSWFCSSSLWASSKNSFELPHTNI